MSPKRLVLLISLLVVSLVFLWVLEFDPPAPKTDLQPGRDVQREPAEPTASVSPPVSEAPVEAPTQVAGVVRSLSTNKPIPNAEVLLASSFGSHSIVALSTTATDASGSFTFGIDDLPESTKGYLSVRASAEGFVPYDHPQAMAPAPGESLDVGVLRLTRGVRVEGKVYLPSGAPAESGTIHLIDALEPSYGGRLDGTRVRATARIHRDGRFVTFVSGPQFALHANVAGYAPRFTEVLSTELTQPIEIQVQPGAALRGVVADTQGNPIAGVKIAASAFASRRGQDSKFGYYGSQWVSETDAQGSFSMTDLPQDSRLYLNCSHPQYREVTLSRIAPGQFTEVCMFGGRVLRAAFVGGDGRRGFPAMVTLRTPEGETVRFWREGNSYLSACFRADSSAGQLEARGFLSQLVTWPEGTGVHDLGLLRLEAGPHVRVRLRNEAGGVVRGQIQAVPADSSGTPSNLIFALTQAIPYATDRAGVAVIGGLFDVPYEIVATAVGYSSQKIRAVPSAGGTEVVLTLPEPGAWSVRVTGNGSPIAGAEVEIRNEGSDFAAVSRAGEDGVVHFFDVPLNAHLHAVARAPGFLSHATAISPLQRRERMDPDIRLVPGVDVALCVANESGQPVSGAAIRLELEESDSGANDKILAESLTDGEGCAVLRGLTPGRYQLAVSAWQHPSLEDIVRVSAGTGLIDVRLRSAAQWDYSGRIVYEDGLAVPNAQVCLEPGEYPLGFSDRVCTRTRVDGSFSLRSENRFEEDVSLFVRWGCQEKVLPVESIDELPAEVAVPRGANLIVSLVDKLGGPFMGDADLSATNADDGEIASASYRPKRGTLHVEFSDLPPGVIRLNVTAAGYRFNGSPWEVALGPNVQRELALTAVPTKSPEPFAMRVVDEFGQPVVAAVVEISAAGDELESLMGSLFDSAWRQTNSLGVAEWLGFPGVEYAVSVSKRGFQQLELEAPPIELRTVRLKASATVWVAVTDEQGVPVPDIRIHIRSLGGSNEAGGAVAGLAEDLVDEWLPRLLPKELEEFSGGPRHHCGLEPGRHRIRVKTPECFEHLEDIEVAAEQSLEVEVVLPTAFEISGKAMEKDRPVSRAQIKVVSLNQENPGVATLETDQFGNFAASFRRSGEYSFQLLDSTEETPSLRVQVRSGGFVTLDFE